MRPGKNTGKGAPKSCYRLRSVTTGREYAPGDVLDGPDPACASEQKKGRALRGVLEVVYDYEELRRRVAARDLLECRELGVRRWVSLMPVAGARSFPDLVVGDTALVPGGRLGAELGLKRLWLKDDTRNPTGSYKDRASVLVAAKAREAGAATVCTASTGNAATALAGMCASLGLECVVIVPASAPRAKLIQMLSYGARVVPVSGNYDQAFDLSSEACARLGWYNRNTAWNPYTIDGKRTAAFEIWAQLGGRAPDWVVVPVGDGVILSGVYKGFKDLHGLGWIERPPRLLAVQAEGSPALARAFDAGLDDPEPFAGAHSVADSIVVEAPRNGILALRDLRESGGRPVVVSDAEIIDAIARTARQTGVFPEPAAAASIAGLARAAQSGWIRTNETVVALITGTGLKDIDAATRAVRVPAPIAPTFEALSHLAY